MNKYLIDLIVRTLLEIDQTGTAGEFQARAHSLLKDGLGLLVRREHPVRYRRQRALSDTRGRVDLALVGRDGKPVFGIELDRRKPRANSIIKLKAMRLPGIVVVRNCIRTGKVEIVSVDCPV